MGYSSALCVTKIQSTDKVYKMFKTSNDITFVENKTKTKLN